MAYSIWLWQFTVFNFGLVEIVNLLWLFSSILCSFVIGHQKRKILSKNLKSQGNPPKPRTTNELNVALKRAPIIGPKQFMRRCGKDEYCIKYKFIILHHEQWKEFRIKI